MKIPDTHIIWWWRASIAAGGLAVIGGALFAFFLYRRVNTISNQYFQISIQEESLTVSPALIDDVKIFWEHRKPQE